MSTAQELVGKAIEDQNVTDSAVRCSSMSPRSKRSATHSGIGNVASRATLGTTGSTPVTTPTSRAAYTMACPPA
ncbi:hypothetical protein [Amycolatopsis sulphurea]|uniref:hypothetical protein n=1 Tax=Amycolatopsis sulphurea TaxID=76022 RepID=UPI003C2AE925